MARDFSVVAIIAAYNEEDIIGQVVGNLIDQGVDVYLLDHGSTDGTVNEVAPYLGRGLLRVERFPDEGGGSPEDASRFCWETILHRKEAVARELDASWLIHHDADEFRESPWDGVKLIDAIRRVDALGYNAIDFEVFTFWPTHDRFRRGDDVRRVFSLYEPGQPWDKVQIKCWKNTGVPVDLASSGGHEAVFDGRRVFPLRFVLRHYPIRGQVHGERKVFRERVPRFAPGERDRGWHVQYDGIREGHCFIRDTATLTAYDPHAVRLGLILCHRGVEGLEGEVAELRRALEVQRRAEEGLERLAGSQRAELAAVYASRSWRWTAPLRAAQRLLLGR